MAAVVGHASLAGTLYELGTLDWASGVGPAVVAVPANAAIVDYTACNAGGVATVQVGAKPIVTLPTLPSTFKHDVGGGVQGPVNVTFAGAGMSTWFLQWVVAP